MSYSRKKINLYFVILGIIVALISLFVLIVEESKLLPIFSKNLSNYESDRNAYLSNSPSSSRPRKNITTATLVNTLSGGGWYYALGITPDGKTLVSGDYGTLKIWRLFSQ
jgi:hypothetical protein